VVRIVQATENLTAELSLDVALKVGSCFPFFEHTTSKEAVSQLKPSLNPERVNDVAKMLSVIVKDLRMKTKLSSEAKSYSREKRIRFRLNLKTKGIPKIIVKVITILLKSFFGHICRPWCKSN
jgi:hypothetical protein